MSRRTDRLALPGQTPGSEQRLTIHRFGTPGARPKAYLQASLHADETPALLVQHHLARLLDAADRDGGITGEIVIVPYANPIGLAQFVEGYHLGRHDLGGAGNFNRNWPDLFAPVAEKLGDGLTGDAEANVALVRSAMAAVLQKRKPASPLESLRLLLMLEAIDADLVLDLHCDDEALMHLFTVPAHWPAAADLAAELGCRAVLLADPSGGDPFDEAFSSPWVRLAARFPERPIPPACLSATVELRGRADVSDELASADAGAVFRVLQRRGLVAGDSGPPPAPLAEATRLDAVDAVKAPAAGVLAYAVAPGDEVTEGQTIAELVDPAAGDPAEARRRIVSRTDGLVLSRRLHKYVLPGMTVAKVVGKRSLPHRAGGYLLED
jgi:predicted deacylase